MEVSWLLLGVLVAISAVQTEGNVLTITPKMAHTQTWYHSINITCQSSQRLKDCQFRVWVGELNYDNLELEINLTNRSEQSLYGYVNGNYRKFSDYTFDDAEFTGGQCVLRMYYISIAGRYFVGCRVRNDSSGWNYAHMALVVPADQNYEMIYFSNNPLKFKHVAVELNKKSPDIEFNAINLKAGLRMTDKILMGCEIFYPNQNINSSEIIVKLNQNENFIDNTTYSARLEGNTSCIASLNVTQSSNGLLWCLFDNKPVFIAAEYTTFDLAIIQALVTPKIPKLTTFINSSVFGDTLTAQCTVEDARPVARIVWTLGDDVIRNDTDDDDVDRAWSWPWDVKSTTQVLTLTLTARVISKELTCKVFYPNASVLWWSENTNHASFESNNSTLLIVVVVIFLMSLGVVNVIFCLRRTRSVVITAELHQLGETDNEPHYDEINETVFSRGAPTTPPVPGRPRERRGYRQTVPRELAPPCPEDPDYIIPGIPDDLDTDGYIRPLAKTSIGKGGKSR